MRLSKEDKKINDRLLSEMLIAFCEEDELAQSIANTKMLKRLDEDKITLNDIVWVYKNGYEFEKRH